MGEFPSGQRGQTVNLLAMPSVVRIHSLPYDAGWSSLEARRAHNPKVVGSNPTPAILPGLISNPGIFYENRDNQNEVICQIICDNDRSHNFVFRALYAYGHYYGRYTDPECKNTRRTGI